MVNRFVATGEMKILMVLLLTNCTITIDPKSKERPSFNSVTIGVMKAIGDLPVIIRKRE
jgi:hypothetical protein